MDPRQVVTTVMELLLHSLIELQAKQRMLLLFFLNRMRARKEKCIRESSLLPANLMLLQPPPPLKTRHQWMKVRSKDWWERVVLTEFTEQEWTQKFRMTRLSFTKLCTLMESRLAPDDVTVPTRIPLMMRVAVALCKLGSCAEYRVIADQFGISKSSVKRCVYMFCKNMMSGPVKQLIRAPTDAEALEISRGFEASHHIPQVMGVIDGSHIPVLPPSDVAKDFVNSKGWPSYVLQAVVDNNCCFWSISCKMPGSAHDADALRHSDLYQKAHLLPKSVRDIEGKDISLFIVGDPAYPVLDWLIKEYPTSPRLTPQQESFNAYLSKVRVGVEVTFGMLKSRWRVLLKRSDFHFSFAPTMIATCCALHNFCQRERDYGNSNWLEEACDCANNYPQPNQPVALQCSVGGNSAREALTAYMSAKFPLRTGILH